MFRLFLVNLVQSGKVIDQNASVKNSLPPRRHRNRRIYERFDIDYKHLSLMNEQDILIIRDLSENGFSTEVSDRGFKRLEIGDIYQCRLRYLGEIYEANAKVIWKSRRFVGFELVQPSAKIKNFMHRLLKPIAIGTSLQKVDEKFEYSSDNEGMIWYHGPNATNFYIWQDDEGVVRSWRLEEKNKYIKWDTVRGIRTGQKSPIKTASVASPWESEFIEDAQPDKRMKQFATDVFMAMLLPTKAQLIESIEG